MNKDKHIGIIGLGHMGQGLAINIINKGHRISVFNRHIDGLEENVAVDFITKGNYQESIDGYDKLKLFVESISCPRIIILLVSAGKAVDDLIDQLSPYLDPGDLLIDAGNSYFKHTNRRLKNLEKKQIDYLGIGVSGGPEGAINGPSVMVGGNGYEKAQDLLCSISAVSSLGKPCCNFIGPGGAGHYVKMVHNGLEYAEMQLIAEIYQLFRYYCSLAPKDIADIFHYWQKSELSSYLLHITKDILLMEDNGNAYVDKILDKAGQKGTGSWVVSSAIEIEIPSNTMSEALMARYLSGMKNKRIEAEKKYNPQRKIFSRNIDEFIRTLQNAYKAARIINHAICFDILNKAKSQYSWQANLLEIADLWTKGCIVQSTLMENLVNTLSNDNHLLLDDNIVMQLKTLSTDLTKLVGDSLDAGYPIPLFSSCLNYFLSFTQANSVSNLIQAQRNHFGNHTLEFNQ